MGEWICVCCLVVDLEVACVSLHNVLSKINTYFNLAIVIVSTQVHYFISNLCYGTNNK